MKTERSSEANDDLEFLVMSGRYGEFPFPPRPVVEVHYAYILGTYVLRS